MTLIKITLFFLLALALSPRLPSLGADEVVPGAKGATPAPKTIVFSTPTPKNATGFQTYQRIYSMAFRRLGYDFRLEALPVRRSIASANSGVTDGDSGRIPQLAESGDYPNLIKVPETIGYAQVAVFATHSDLRFDSWESLQVLRGTKTLIGYSRGFKAVEIQLPRYLDERNMYTVTDALQGCRMLSAKRLNFVIEPRSVMEQLLRTKMCKADNIRLVGILETVPVYPYLNKKHAELAPKLAEVLHEMKKAGDLKMLNTGNAGDRKANPLP